MGTPIAVESLKALVENGYNVVGVITMPDKPAGRGYKLQSSPVKQYALEKGLTVLQPEKLKEEGFLKDLKELKADLQVVVAFRMLPEVVWNMPPQGTFNLHSSLLPQYRGAAPINWAIINGEKETGVTTFFLSHDIDTGAILFREKTAITTDDTAGSLHDRLMKMGAGLVLKTVDAIMEGTARPTPQRELVSDEASLKRTQDFQRRLPRGLGKGRRTWYLILSRAVAYPARGPNFIRIILMEPSRVKVYGSKIVGQETVAMPRDVQPGTLVTDNKVTFM